MTHIPTYSGEYRIWGKRSEGRPVGTAPEPNVLSTKEETMKAFRKTILAAAVLALALAALVPAALRTGAEEKPAPAVRPSAPEPVTFMRYPETGWFMPPEGAAAVRMRSLSPEWEVTEVRLVEPTGNITPHSESCSAPVASAEGAVLRFPAERGSFALFVGVKPSPSAADAPLPFLSHEFIDAAGKPMPRKLVKHTTGKMVIGSGITAKKLVFQSCSPIVRFAPVVESARENRADLAWDRASSLYRKPCGGLRFRYLSPFRVEVELPPWKYLYHYVSAEMTLEAGFEKRGHVFAVWGDENYVTPVTIEDTLSGKSAWIPPGTREITVTLLDPFAPVSATLRISDLYGDRTVQKPKSNLAVDLVEAPQRDLPEWPAYSFTFRLDEKNSSLKKLLKGLDKEGAAWELKVKFNPFFPLPKLAERPEAALYSFECKSKDGSLKADLAPKVAGKPKPLPQLGMFW